MALIRIMEPEDVAFGVAMCRIAGWNQVEADWRRLLALAPEGVFVAEEDGRPCGTGCAAAFGDRVGWISMVLVHPDFRRRGIGSQIMRRCIDHLRGRGVRSIQLFATEEGLPVYRKLGFGEIGVAWRSMGRSTPSLAAAMNGECNQPPRDDVQVRPIDGCDWPAIARLDLMAYGADRLELLKMLWKEGPSAALCSAGDVWGYGFARPGHHAAVLGPVVATSDVGAGGLATGADAARDLVQSLLGALPEGDVNWGFLDDNSAAGDLAKSLGFQPRARRVRMCLGEASHTARAELLYGVTSFELG